MRWYWIDRFIEFESGRYATAVKNVTASEEYLSDHFLGYPLLPNTLVTEGLAQTGGLLVFEHNRFTENPILAKVPMVRFFGEVVPGDRLTYTATIEEVKPEGALVRAISYNGDQLQAEMEMMFAHFHCAHRTGRMSNPEVFLNMMRVLGAFEVARRPDGSRVVEPRRPAEAVVASGGKGSPSEDQTAPRLSLMSR